MSVKEEKDVHDILKNAADQRISLLKHQDLRTMVKTVTAAISLSMHKYYLLMGLEIQLHPVQHNPQVCMDHTSLSFSHELGLQHALLERELFSMTSRACF